MQQNIARLCFVFFLDAIFVLTESENRISYPYFNNFRRDTTMNPTYNPSKLKRARRCGWRARNKTRGGKAVIAARRQKGRKRLVTK